MKETHSKISLKFTLQEALERVCMFEVPLPVIEKGSNINSHQLSAFNDDEGWECMYVSKPFSCEGFLGAKRNDSHPTAWPLGDPQKVIHIDPILLLVYIHTKPFSLWGLFKNTLPVRLFQKHSPCEAFSKPLWLWRFFLTPLPETLSKPLCLWSFFKTPLPVTVFFNPSACEAFSKPFYLWGFFKTLLPVKSFKHTYIKGTKPYQAWDISETPLYIMPFHPGWASMFEQHLAQGENAFQID